MSAITEYCDDRRLPIRERVLLFADACRIVHAAHGAGTVFGDLMPSSIHITGEDEEPRIRISDPEIESTGDQESAERSLYASPEHGGPDGVEPDPRADVYSLGVVLYELVAGALPHDEAPSTFEGVTGLFRERGIPEPSSRLCSLPQQNELAALRGGTVAEVRRELRSGLDDLVLAALHEEPARRYGSALELAEEIDHFVGQTGFDRLRNRVKKLRL